MKTYQIAEGLSISGKWDDESELLTVGQNFDVVINLWHKHDELSLQPVGKRMYIHYPMRDGKINDQIQFLLPMVFFVQDLLDNGKNILIHCMGGRNRSALLAALVMKSEINSDIIEQIRKVRGPSALGNEEFVKFIQEYVAV